MRVHWLQHLTNSYYLRLSRRRSSWSPTRQSSCLFRAADCLGLLYPFAVSYSQYWLCRTIYIYIAFSWYVDGFRCCIAHLFWVAPSGPSIEQCDGFVFIDCSTIWWFMVFLCFFLMRASKRLATDLLLLLGVLSLVLTFLGLILSTSKLNCLVLAHRTSLHAIH